jgi:NAD(P)-dependent dehydrogenase (short-subunit alcohol dehydrogenase family)
MLAAGRLSRMDLGLRDAAAVVAGGSSGMGRAAAECLAEEGARVAVLGRRQALLDAAVASLRERGSPDALGLVADVGDDASVRRAIDALGARWGQIHALVNTVGPGDLGEIDALTDEQWARSLDLGVMSAVRCVRAALPWLRKAPWARIVNVSAHSVKRQTPRLIAYTAAKAALTSVSKNLARTLAPEGILVNTVSPGTFLSGGLMGWLERVAEKYGIDPKNPEDANRVIREEFGEPSDLGRVGLPEEVGAVIAFLASRRNSYMTGADVNVDGGSDFT